MIVGNADAGAIDAAASEVQSRGFATLRNFIDTGVARDLLETAREILFGATDSPASSGRDGLILRNIMSARGTAEPAADGKKSYHVEHVFRHQPQFRSIMADPKCVALARAILKDTPVVLDDQLYWKPMGSGGETYLHRDSDFFGPMPVVTLWIPLTDVDERSGCLWFAPGSGSGDDAEHGVRRRAWQPSDDPDRDRRLDYFYEIDDSKLALEPAPASPGDLVALNSEVLHLSHQLAPDTERISYLIEYTGYRSLQNLKDKLKGLFSYHDREQHMFVCAD